MIPQTVAPDLHKPTIGAQLASAHGFIPDIHATLCVTLDFLNLQEFANWTNTSKENRSHDRNKWWLRTRVRPYTSKLDHLMRRANLKTLWRQNKSLSKWLSSDLHLLMKTRRFHKTFFDHTAGAKSVVFRELEKDGGSMVMWDVSMDPTLRSDPDIALASVKKNYRLLCYVDKTMPEFTGIATVAVERDWRAFRYVGGITVDGYATIALAAVKTNAEAMVYVNPTIPEYLEIALAAVAHDWRAIEYVRFDWVPHPLHPIFKSALEDLSFCG